MITKVAWCIGSVMCWWVALRGAKLNTGLFLALLSLRSCVGFLFFGFFFLTVVVCLGVFYRISVIFWVFFIGSLCLVCCVIGARGCVRAELLGEASKGSLPSPASIRECKHRFPCQSSEPVPQPARHLWWLIEAVITHNTRGGTAKCRLVLCVISGAELAGAFMKILSGNDSNIKINST